MFRLSLFFLFIFLLLLAQGSSGFWGGFASNTDGDVFASSSSKKAISLRHPKADVGSISPGSVKMGVVSHAVEAGGVGANWGSQASHRLPPEIVVRMLRQNGVRKVKLFDSDYDTLRALGGSGIQVMVGIPNDMLSMLAGSSKAAERWVSQNVSHHLTNNVMIKSVYKPDKARVTIQVSRLGLITKLPHG